MTTNTPQTPWQNVRNIHREYADDYRILGVIGMVLVGLLIFSGDRLSYSMNAYTELLSIVVTVVVLDRLAARRAEKQRKAELIAQMASPNNAVAVGAATLMMHLGWGFGEDSSLERLNFLGANLAGASLSDANLAGASLSEANLVEVYLRRSNLAGAYLSDANLAGANLSDSNLEEVDLRRSNLEGAKLINTNLRRVKLINAKLEGANLWGAKLEGADLWGAKLEGVNLIEANLERTNLSFAKLEGADLGGANLKGADLGGANLKGADLGGANLNDTNLWAANLSGANLRGARFNERIMLPDAILENGNYIPESYWTPDTDMSKYTDPNHPEFWQPEWAQTDKE